jgi:Ca2+:H+ antiporter
MFGPTLTHTASIVGRRRNSIDSASEYDSLLGRTGRGETSEEAQEPNGQAARKVAR